MRLITNDNSGHRAAIEAVLTGSSEALVAVAFLKVAGARFLCDLLRPVLRGSGQASVFVGTDFFLTEPDALQLLLEESGRSSGLSVHIGARAGATFHPKVYAGFRPDGFRCLVGSANLTGGALGANAEASILVEDGATADFEAQVRTMFGDLAGSDRFRPLDALGLAAYRSAWRPVERARDQLDSAMDAADSGGFDLDLLETHHRRYLADPRNPAELKARISNRRKARIVQARIGELGREGLSRTILIQTLRTHLQDLMSSADGGRHLWHSDAIFRRAGEALNHPNELISLFEASEAAARLPALEGYGMLRDIAKNIPGVGINMITEILSTFEPRRFAVVNGNTVAALAHLGLTFQGSTSLQLPSVKPARYVEIVGLIDAVRQRIGAADYPETDAFLNWVYQQT